MSLDFDQNVSAQKLVDILPEGIAILNHQYELLSVNRRFRELIPCANDNFHECWLQSVHPDDYDRVAATRYDEVTGSNQTLRIEYHTRDPGSIWCVMTLRILEKNDIQTFGLGDKGGFICIMTDINLEKKAELSQKRAAQEAQECKQQQERFIDMISHEIRNPLSAILQCTEDILEATKPKGMDKARTLDVTEAAETINLCITHQQRIVNDVLTYSKLDASMLAISPQRVQPKRHLTKPLAIFRPEIRRQHIKLQYKADLSYAEYGIEWVMADLDRMNQVLVNLISNSIKFTARSENERMIRVSIGASLERPSSYPPNVVFFNSSPSALRQDATDNPEWGLGEVAYVMVAVRDSGIGITDQAQKRLFERFNQATPGTQSIYGGYGLGLNVCRKLCYLHGGEIGVSSKDGEGSTFGFFFKVRRSNEGSDNGYGKADVSAIEKLSAEIQSLGNETSGGNRSTEQPKISEPLAMSIVGELDSAAADDDRTIHTEGIARRVSNERRKCNSQSLSDNHDDEGQAANARILLVEDNNINMRILSQRLKALGFNISEAINGQEAVDAAKDNTFDCILMDKEMSVMDGYSATKAIRGLEKESGVHTPILGVTASIRAEEQAKMLNVGMDDIIHKPYSTDDILQRIKQLIDRSRE